MSCAPWPPWPPTHIVSTPKKAKPAAKKQTVIILATTRRGAISKSSLTPEFYWIDLIFGLQLEWAAGRSDKAIVQLIIRPMRSSRDATCRVTMSGDRDLVTLGGGTPHTVDGKRSGLVSASGDLRRRST
jgi:hypothetical protein